MGAEGQVGQLHALRNVLYVFPFLVKSKCRSSILITDLSEIEPLSSQCKYAKYCRHFSANSEMCTGGESNRCCPVAVQFRLFNKSRCIEDDSLHVEAKWLL